MAGGRTRVCRKATKGKGKRWLKGQSSSSNPETTKFRDAAKNPFSKFGHVSGGKSNLTVDVLKKHEISQHAADNGDLGYDMESICAKTVKTFDSFATVWTACTNPSFDRLLKKWQPKSAVSNDRLAVLAAVTDIIKTHGGKETETEYFAALMTALDALDSEELITACVNLIGLIMKRLSPTILKKKFSETSKVFMELMKKYLNVENPSLMKGIIGCQSVMLRAQETAIWRDLSTLQTFEAILLLTTDNKPRVRKAAQHAVCAILKGSTFMLATNAPLHHPATLTTANFCIQILKQHGGSGETTTLLHVLGLLKNIMSVFPQKELKLCCEEILQCRALGNVLITSCCLQTLHGLFVNQPKANCLSADLNARLITAFYDFQFSENDTQPLIAWLTVMKEAHNNLLRLDETLCLKHLARFFTFVAGRCWQSLKPEVCSGVTSTLKALLYICGPKLAPKIEAMLLSAPPNSITPAHEMFKSIEDCLSLKYHNVWAQVFHVLAVFFEVLGPACHSIMKKCIRSLAALRRAANFRYANELDYAIGKAVGSIGPSTIIECIPLNFLEADCSFEQSWLLPVLRDNICATRLGYFSEYFLPMAFELNDRAKKHAANGKLALSKSYELLHNQIWSLLPGFCTSPTDLCQSFKLIAQKLGKELTDSAHLRLDIMASLRILISKNHDNPENIKALAKFAKNYLHILFNLYTTTTTSEHFCGEGTRLAVFDTIKVYLQIADKELSATLFDKAFETIEDNKDTFIQQAILDILRVLLPNVDIERTTKIYGFCLTMLQDKNRTVQKKAYRMFEELCSGNTENSRQIVRDSLPSLKTSLADALSMAIPSSKAPRLRCLSHIISHLTENDSAFILSLIPEVLNCTKEAAVKVRTTAASLLITIGEKLLEFGGKPEKEIIKSYVEIFLAGFSLSSHMICATLISLSHVIGYFRDKVSNDVLKLVLDNVSVLLQSKVREVVSAALEFLKAIISTFRDIDLAQHVQPIILALASMTEDCKSHSRMRIRRIFQRLIRKFGFPLIQQQVPECFRKLITHIRKMEARDKKRHANLKNNDSDDDEDEDGTFSLKVAPQTIDDILRESESDSEDEEPSITSKFSNKKKKSTKGMTWIQEGEEEIIDLLDSKASHNILTTRPDVKDSKKTKDVFKIAPDGRLIIVDEDKAEKPSKSGDAAMLPDQLVEPITSSSNTKGIKRKRDDDEDSEDGQSNKAPPMKYQAGGIGIHRPIHGRSQKSNPRDQADGSDYKAKRAGGDMKRRGKPDPYAYVPLNMQSLNKRKKAKFAGQFKGMVRGAQKGAKRGQKSRSRQGKPK